METKICSYCDASKSRIGMCVPTKRQGMKKDITTYVSKRFDLLEALNERKCRSPVLWDEIGEIWSIGPELVQETTNKEYWTDANMHVPLEEIKVHKTLHFVVEPVEIIDREDKSLKRSRISIVKVCWNSKRDYEDFMETKYPHLLIEQVIVGSTN
ncbi:hypothetical protein Tco_1491727 [Tanacetum coccineum]